MDGDITQIAPLTLTNTRQSIVDLGIATDDEVDATLAELETLAGQETTVVSMPRVVQAWAVHRLRSQMKPRPLMAVQRCHASIR